MKKNTLLLVCTLGLLIACAEVMNALESNTDENTQAGKLVRGANRLRKSFQDLDPSEEHYVGRAVAAQVLSMPSYRLSGDAGLQDYVNHVGQAVSLSSDRVRQTFAGYRFAVIESPEINAFAAPGGTVLVTSGLVRTATIEDELAGVLAHEVAHVTLRHGLAAIKQSNLVEAFQYLGDATLEQQNKQKLNELFGASIDDVIGTMVKNGYSRDAEFEADGLGHQILGDSGYDPGALHSFLVKLRKSGASGGFFSTHPSPNDRLSNLPPLPPPPTDRDAIAVRLQRFGSYVR